MTSSSRALLAALAAGAAACGSHASPAAFKVVAGDNVVAISVNGACGGVPYVNEPCASVKVCAPGSTTSCQIIGGLLVDTGSFGLRLFKEALSPALLPALPAVAAPGGGALAECVQYADLSSDWGPVVKADVVLGNEPAVGVPIQVIDASYAGTTPSACANAEPGPTPQVPTAFNGILGVGVFVEDCGAPCPLPTSTGGYYAVSGATVTGVSVDPTLQVQNPVGLLPLDGNGVIIQLPGVPRTGARSVDGWMVLGIGTRPNNRPVSARAIPLDGVGDFTTTLAGQAMKGSFADTGSNGLFFAPPSAIAQCTSPTSAGWYCPPTPVSFSATNAGAFGPNQLPASFEIDSIDQLTAGTNAVFANIGGTAVQGGGFDWGLPFFLGRTVYLGIAGRATGFGAGPTLAY